MRIEFQVGDRAVELRRNWFTGRMGLFVDGVEKILADAADIRTQFSVKRVRTWNVAMFGHQVDIKKTRPLLFAGFRPHRFVVSVDGTPVAERRGY